MTWTCFDIETNGLLPELDTIHCVALRNGTGEVELYPPDKVQHALTKLEQADELVGHNIAGFDIPAIQKVFPGWAPRSTARIRDTLVMTRLIWPDIKERDFRRIGSGTEFPKAMIGRQSLEAWGHRLGTQKGEFGKTTDWSKYTDEMGLYCRQDVAVNVALWMHIQALDYSPQAVELEHEFAELLERQVAHGFAFDLAAAEALYRKLQVRRAELNHELEGIFPPFVNKYVTPKKKLERTKEIPFNPNSRDHIARAFTERYGWKPTEFTNEGKPKIDERVLAGLDFPEAELLLERLMLQKRIGQVAEGNQAWLKLVQGDGRIHGRVIHNGAVTGRCTHSRPNVTQVPAGRKPYGTECRACFTVSPGFKLVGVDAAGLELRCLAHYLAKYDGGAYAKALLEGDIHTHNQEAAGLKTRDQAKTFIYAWLYGAGDEKIGSIVGAGRAAGKQLKERFLKSLPALRKLRAQVRKRVIQTKSLRGLDGRVLAVRHPHAALNTLLQSAGAVIMKQATVLLHRELTELGMEWGKHYAQVGHIHDEVQLEVREKHAEFVGKVAVESIRKAGEVLGLRVPLDGSAQIGANWSETH